MSTTRRTYSKEFREQAVDLLLSSGQPLKVLARELGLNPCTLRRWRDERVAKEGPGATGVLPGESAEQELQRLRRENAYLKRQREILKKAMSILSEDPHVGMP